MGINEKIKICFLDWFLVPAISLKGLKQKLNFDAGANNKHNMLWLLSWRGVVIIFNTMYDCTCIDFFKVRVA